MSADPVTAADQQAITDAVVASFAATPDPRLRELLTALTRHLHAFIREVRLTGAEWEAAIAFLTATGAITDERRQEFVLLSDVLGASMQTVVTNDVVTDDVVTDDLVDDDLAVGGGVPAAVGVTRATVLGPFFVEDSPAVELGGDIAAGAPGEPCWVEGTVHGVDGRPVPGARLEVWEADADGLYDVQHDDGRVAARGRLVADADGAYRFWSLTPTPYPIPADGPVGRLLAATARSPVRAPHLHVRVTAPGYREVVTHVFVDGPPDSLRDSVFGVRPSLVRTFARHAAQAPTPDGRVVDGTWTSVRFDVVLAPADVSREGRARGA